MIPAGVTELGDYAFSGCEQLTKVVLPENLSVTMLKGTFAKCKQLTDVVLPENLPVTELEKTFSDCTSLSNVVLPGRIQKIGANVFANCSSLQSVTIPGSLKSIDYSAFSKTSRLTEAYYGGTEAQWMNIVNYNTPCGNATIHFNSKVPGGTLEEDALITMDNSLR